MLAAANIRLKSSDSAIVAPGGQVPVPDGYSERAIYLVAGSLSVAGNALEEGDLLILGEGEEADIRVASFDGTNECLVAGGAGRKTSPKWSDDGRAIYFDRTGAGATDLLRAVVPDACLRERAGVRR